ncbi:hypothetical protein CBM2626_B150336 [Cupriavidus taiwanensis]|nr:hypothetical protein CBM2626_B150336 [Cupriavidus taiwanensis]
MCRKRRGWHRGQALRARPYPTDSWLRGLTLLPRATSVVAPCVRRHGSLTTFRLIQTI